MQNNTDRNGLICSIGSWLLRLLTAIGVAMAALILPTPIALAAECRGWTLIDGQGDLAPAYPDTHVRYWVWSFSRTRLSMTTAFRIKGQFPYARYMSFQTYSSTQGDALQDFEIVPDAGSINPFQPDMDGDALARSYTVWFVPPTSAQHQNTIEMPTETSSPNLVLRIVRADQDQPDGGVPLPTIEAFDHRTGQPVACPARGQLAGLVEEPSEVPPLPSPENPISFYRVTGAGFAPNVVNGYLAARLADPGEGTLAALWFARPSFPDTYNQPETELTGDEDVRYMGLCVHGLMSTLTSECLCDDELQPAPGNKGLVKVVVGPEDSSVRANSPG